METVYGLGSFTEHSSYGSLKLNEFCGLAVTGEDVEHYIASLYYINTTTIHIVLSLNEEAQLSVTFNVRTF